jgi:hypothetical protein
MQDQQIIANCFPFARMIFGKYYQRGSSYTEFARSLAAGRAREPPEGVCGREAGGKHCAR